MKFRGLLGLLALPAICLTLSAQDKKPAAQADAAGQKNEYRGRLISIEQESKRIVFKVTRGGSTRMYNLPMAAGMTIRDGNAEVGSLPPNAPVVVAVIKSKDKGEEVATLSVDHGDGAGRPAPMGTGTGKPTGGSISLAFPTGDRASSLLVLETKAPDEVRVGEGFDFEITVTNISEHVTLEDVHVRQHLSDSLEARRHGSEGQAKGPKKESKKDDAAAKKGAGNDNKSAQNPSGSQSTRELEWMVPELAPGQSMTLRAPVVAHKAGTVGSCFRVSYEPALCVRITAAEPSIQLTKTAPEEVRFCDLFQYTYTVKNTGSAEAQNVVVTDKLADGLAAKGGKTQIREEVGNLGPNESREFTVDLLAAGRGQYTSRAQATAKEAKPVYSAETTTTVREAHLGLTMDGPSVNYAGQPATYTVVVSNEGDAPAPNTTLTIDLDDRVKFDHAGGADGDKPTAGEGNVVAIDVGMLPAGKSKKYTVTTVGRAPGKVEHKAVAKFVCSRAVGDAEAMARANAAATSEIRVIPALRLSLVDQSDLIKVGEDVTYTLQVINQGTGPDNNLTIKVMLPGEVEYVDGNGPTEIKAEGQTLSLGVVKQLDPGKVVTWNLRVKAKTAKDVRTTASLDSDYLDAPVETTEPTRLIENE